MVGVLALSLASGARADALPPDDYVETCTSEIQAREGETCVECPTHVGYDGCTTTWTAQGYHRRCSQWGATHRVELWCSGAPIGPIVPEPTLGLPSLGIGVGEALILGFLCCLLGGGGLAGGALLVFALRPKSQRGGGS